MIKAYDGPERPDGQVATLQTERKGEPFAVPDVEIVAVDGVNYKRPHYAARMVPGTHWIGILSTVRISSQKREQFCAFELNFEPACTYRPFLPSYPTYRYFDAGGDLRKAIADHEQAFDAARRKELAASVQKGLWDEAVWVFLWQLDEVFGLHKKVKGFTMRADHMLWARETSVES